MELEGYAKEEYYNYSAKWNKEKSIIEITIDYKKTLEKTEMIVTLNRPDYIKSSSGKSLENKNSSIDFKGQTVLPKGVEETTESFASVGGQSARAMAASSAGILSVSSLFTNSLSCLSKLIQIIEFTSLIEFFNFEYDPILGSFLSRLSELTKFDLIPFPVNDWVSHVGNSEGSQWKGKLSQAGMKPYYLQELGYVGLIMLVRIMTKIFSFKY